MGEPLGDFKIHELTFDLQHDIQINLVQYVFVDELTKYNETDKKKGIDCDILFDSCQYIKCPASPIKTQLVQK